MEIKLFDGELKVMDALWQEGDSTARHLADILKERVGWNINTAYTMIKRCVAKGAIERREPSFQCHALITREEVQLSETEELIDKIFGGSADLLFSALLSHKKVSDKNLKKMRRMIEEAEEESGDEEGVNGDE